jgi:hypothetical protein
MPPSCQTNSLVVPEHCQPSFTTSPHCERSISSERVDPTRLPIASRFILVPILAYRDHPLLIIGDMEGMPLSVWFNGIRPNVQRPFVYVVLGDGDQWVIEAEWPDGSVESIRTFRAYAEAVSWVKTHSATWMR